MESYKHKYAKEILQEWLKNDFVRINLEEKFILDGRISFIPDLTCYDENGLSTIYEVVHKSELNDVKLARMQFYFYMSDVDVNIYEIGAEWIMRQIEKPDKLEYINFTTKVTDEF